MQRRAVRSNGFHLVRIPLSITINKLGESAVNNLSIRKKITFSVGILGIAIILLSAIQVFQAAKRLVTENKALEIVSAGTLLVTAAGSWAVERGTTAGVLGGGGKASAKQKEVISARRKTADEALEKAIAIIDSLGVDADIKAEEDKVFAAHKKVKELRKRVDAVLSSGSTENDPGLRAEWFPTITKLIVDSAHLREREEINLFEGLPKEVVEAIMLRDAAWVWAEHAGRERGLLAGIISSGEKMSPQQVAKIEELVGIMAGAIERIDILKRDMPASVVEKIDAAESFYKQTLSPLRKKIIEAGAKGEPYPINGADWFAEATKSIVGTLSVSRDLSAYATDAVRGEVAQDTTAIIVYVIVTILAVGVIVFAWRMAANQVAGPIEAITDAIEAVASGDNSAVIPGTDRQDEIGVMASSMTKIQGAARDATRLQTMVENMPINVMMADPETLDVTYANKTTIETLKQLEHLLPIKAEDLVGTCIDVFHKHPEHQRKMLADPSNLPHNAKINVGDEILELNVSAIIDGQGTYIGPMVTWEIVTEQTKIANEAISVTEMATKSAERVLKTSEIMVKGTEQSSNKSVDVADLAQETLDRITAVAAATEELASSVSEVESQVQRSSEVAQSAVRRANDANDKVTGLAEAAKRIGNVVELIRDVAEQTNLLALNATIEAARAGDAGKGFAVVASEVKNLANQTTKATEEISAQIVAVQTETAESVQAIQEITQVITDIEAITNEVRSAIEQQTDATREISSNVQESTAAMNRVADNVSDVTQRNLLGMGASIKVIWQTRKLLDPMQNLRTSIDKFLKS